MPELKKSNIEVITKNGECKLNISLDININLTSEGLSVTAQATKVIEEEEKEASIWAIPDFKMEKVNFGKKG